MEEPAQDFSNCPSLHLLKDEISTVFSLVIAKTSCIMLRIFWHFLHLVISVCHVLLSITLMLQSYIISSGLFKKYEALNLTKVQCLGIVVENEEAHGISRVIQLLRWLAQVGVKHVCLYDMDGVLKKFKNIILQELGDATSRELETDEKCISLDQKQMTVGFASFSDGKEGIANAANFLCSEFVKVAAHGRGQDEPVFTESDMARALRAVGCEGPEPNLLLTYGPVRCHLGFPAWRMRYTEIVHMGPLKTMRYGALVKVIEEFTKVHQNYGT